MLVVFGPSPQSYVVAAGRRFFCEGMPESLASNLSSVIAIMQVDWISIDSEGKTWVAHDFVTETYHFDLELDPTIHAHLGGTDGKPPSNYVTFPTEAGSYFIKHIAHGGWSAILEPPYVDRVSEMRKEYDGFDSGLIGIIFGKDTSHIYLHETDFVACLSAEAQDPEHVLSKTLTEFSEINQNDDGANPWLLLKRSQLCSYDSQYFFLAFKKSDSNIVQYRWNLPQEMNDNFDALRRTAELPDERHAINLAEQQIQLQQQQTMMMEQQLVASRIAQQQTAASMIATIRNRGYKAALAAVSGRELVYRDTYF